MTQDLYLYEEPEFPYQQAMEGLERARLAFRELNRKLRKAGFEITVQYKDE